MISLSMRFGILSPPMAFGRGLLYGLLDLISRDRLHRAVVSSILVRLASTGGGKNVRISNSALGPGSLISGPFAPSFNGDK